MPNDNWNGAAVIEKRRLAQNRAIEAHDLDAVASYWTSDVMLTASDGNALVGRDGYRDGLEAMFDRFPDAVYVRTPTRIEQSADPELALEQGTWEGRWTDTGRLVAFGGSYMAQWRLEDNVWMIRSELFVATSAGKK